MSKQEKKVESESITDEGEIYSMGVDDEAQIKEFVGTYVGTERKVVHNKPTLIHLMKNQDGKNCKLWGKAKLNNFLPTLPVNTPVEIKCLGKVDIGKPQPMLDFDIRVPKGTPRVENRFIAVKKSE